MVERKVRILFVGPSACGKTRLSNYICGMDYLCPKDMEALFPLRILEYDMKDVDVDEEICNIDVELWDANGREEFVDYWSAYRMFVDGVIFVNSQQEESGPSNFDLMYDYFVTQKKLDPGAALVCNVHSDRIKTRLSSRFAKVAQIVVDLEHNGEKFKEDFAKYVLSVVRIVGKSGNGNNNADDK